MRTEAADKTAAEDIDFALVRNDLPIRWQRKLGLAPANGPGVGRRAAFFALLTWLPIVLWAAAHDRLLAAPSGEPLLWHYGIHVRCLVAIPLLILSEAVALAVTRRIVPQFVSTGLVSQAQQRQFATLVREVGHLRDASLPWVLIFGFTLVWLLAGPTRMTSDELSWAAEGGGLGFGGWWLFFFSRGRYSWPC